MCTVAKCTFLKPMAAIQKRSMISLKCTKMQDEFRTVYLCNVFQYYYYIAKSYLNVTCLRKLFRLLLVLWSLHIKTLTLTLKQIKSVFKLSFFLVSGLIIHSELELNNHLNMADTDDAKKKPKCKYWDECYRKDPNHRKNFQHPGDVKDDDKGRFCQA